MKHYTSPSIKVGLFVDAGNSVITTSEEQKINYNGTATVTTPGTVITPDREVREDDPIIN